ncbi:MAG: AAA family ATPase, partial [Clostridia bacterium]
MKIITAHVYGYGRLVNRTFNFSKGMNVVLGYNETGKSTLMSFIKAMLYGHKKNEREGKDGSIPENKKYKPWDTDKYGGYIIIETDSKRMLRIERDFNNRTLSVYNEYNEEITNEFSYSKESGMLGQDILGMDIECFTNSSYMCQDKNLLYPEDKEHIAQKLMNISESGEEEVSVLNAVRKLKEGITYLGNERTSKRKFNILNSQLEHEEKQLRIMQEDNQKCMEYLTEAEEIKKELEKLEIEEKLAIRKQIYESVSKSINEYDRYNKEIKALREKLSEIDIDMHNSRKQKFDTDAKRHGNLEQAYKNLFMNEKDNHKKITISIISAVLIIAATAVLAVIINVWLLLAALVAVPFIVFVFLANKKNKKISIEIKELEKLIETGEMLEQAEARLREDDTVNDLILRY